MTLPFPINYTYHPSGGEFGGGLYYANTQEAITKQYADMTNQFASRCKNNRGVWNNGVCGPNQVGGVSGMGGV